MYLVAHGGHCCGIRTIFGFAANPADGLSATTGQQIKGLVPNSLFVGSLPAQTFGERFEAYIDFQQWSQRKGIIEVVLIDCQITKWKPLLDKHDFKETFSGHNSNSGNIVHIFHKAYVPKPKVKADPKAAASLRAG